MKQTINSINIKGKLYSTVDARVSFFRENYPDWTIKTSFPVPDLDKGVCLAKVEIINPEGKILADGFAYEWQSKQGSLVNKTSFIENAQTSAVGRALGFMGIGIVGGQAIATADEVNLKIQHQDNNDLAPTIQIETLQSVPVQTETIQIAPALPDSVVAEINACNSILDIGEVLKKYAKEYDRNLLSSAASLRKEEILNTLSLQNQTLTNK